MFPSLQVNVVPIPDQSSYETLTYLLEWQSTILSSPFQIESHLRSIMGDVTEEEELYIGMDMEWLVDWASSIQGWVAVTSITYEKNVFLLQVCSSKHATSSSYHCSSSLRVVGTAGHLPTSLLAFLCTPCIQKVGLRIAGDLTKMFHDWKFDSSQDAPFLGALDNGRMAKERNTVKKATIC
jgi:hypothetical protein